MAANGAAPSGTLNAAQMSALLLSSNAVPMLAAALARHDRAMQRLVNDFHADLLRALRASAAMKRALRRVKRVAAEECRGLPECWLLSTVLRCDRVCQCAPECIIGITKHCKRAFGSTRHAGVCHVPCDLTIALITQATVPVSAVYQLHQ